MKYTDKITYNLFRLLRKPIRAFYIRERMSSFGKSQLFEDYVELRDQEANDYIRKEIESGKPLMVSKFGGFELTELCVWRSIHQTEYSKSEVWDFLKGNRETLWWDLGIDGLCSNAGFFPHDDSLRQRYYDINLKAMQEIDVLGSYLAEEKQFSDYLKKCRRINLDGYYAPFLFKRPWTMALKGKKVLVVHPFDKDIKSQYERRELLWADQDVLPEFSKLITYKAVQSMLGMKTNYSTWFDALEKMETDISKLDFDVALIGCGAYGMPLAAFVKSLGKQAVHLAGWTQLLFGIKGGRWDDMPYVKRFYNEFWVRPSNIDKPKNAERIENACYW